MRIRMSFLIVLLGAVGVALFTSYNFSQEKLDMTQDLLEQFAYRNIGPFRSGAWITDFAVPEFPTKAHLYTFYVAGRNGGLWKTTNNGTTFESIFDDQDIFSIGDIALAPSSPEILWVGTGEHTTARSAYWGDGVYKSMDGGKTWENMGLRDSHHIGRIVIHPQDPDIVYVAAEGHLFSSNEERGVFKTSDGGKNWEKVLYINEEVGAIDLAINRNDPNILYAASYDKRRFPWHFEAGGPESGIYKTLNAGRTWNRLSGGLPEGNIGRIGLDIYRKNPDIVYAVIENVNTRPPTEEEAQQDRRRGLEPQEREIGGEVYRTDDAGKTWKKMNSTQDNVGGKAAYSFNQIRVDPNNDQNVYVTTICLACSFDGGKTWHDINWPPQRIFTSAFGDIRTLWIDPENSNRIFMGSDGGMYISYDGGKTCDYYDNLPMAQYYAIGVDMDDPYNIYGGLQCHDNWKVPSNSWSGQVTLEDSIPLGTGDGMYNVIDPNDSRWVYNTTQFGGHHRIDQKLGTRTDIMPRREKGKDPYRFNWCPPIHISPHDSEVIYAGTQMLLRSQQRGDNWQEISPDLTLNDPIKIAGKGHIQYCTITTISESPVTPGVIWVGTDDGKVWATKDSGATWQDRTPVMVKTGAPEEYWVSRVLASSHDSGTAYVAKSGFRRDDFRPFLYKTTDFGGTWTSISANLPEKPINVVLEDTKNPDLLFLGNDRGVYVSLNGGEKWLSMRCNMPTIAVHDLLVHPRENDLVVGTYGRGIFITDISPLQELTADILDKDLHLFKVKPKIQRLTRSWGAYHLYGDRHLSTPNEPNSLFIYYYLKDKAEDNAILTIKDSQGNIVFQTKGSAEAGITRAVWDMRIQTSQEPQAAQRRGMRRPLAEPGEYLVTLDLGDKKLSQITRIIKRAGWRIDTSSTVIREN